jgi:hypothetical protein
LSLKNEILVSLTGAASYNTAFTKLAKMNVV